MNDKMHTTASITIATNTGSHVGDTTHIHGQEAIGHTSNAFKHANNKLMNEHALMMQIAVYGSMQHHPANEPSIYAISLAIFATKPIAIMHIAAVILECIAL